MSTNSDIYTFRGASGDYWMTLMNGNVGIGTSNPGTNKLAVTGSINTYTDLVLGSTTTNSWIIHSNQNGTPAGKVLTIAPSNGPGTYDWSKNITIYRSTGNVGIGTPDPGSYKLAVEGKIGAREVVVTTSPWADHVFKDDYNLKPLSEVESFIKEKKHLEGIPTAQEVKENGANVGEIQAKLLEKIEELTLYMIEMKKENETMKSRIANIERLER